MAPCDDRRTSETLVYNMYKKHNEKRQPTEAVELELLHKIRDVHGCSPCTLRPQILRTPLRDASGREVTGGVGNVGQNNSNNETNDQDMSKAKRGPTKVPSVRNNRRPGRLPVPLCPEGQAALSGMRAMAAEGPCTICMDDLPDVERAIVKCVSLFLKVLI